MQHTVYIIVNYQPLAHTTIAMNRFTAFAFPMSHTFIWSRLTVVVAVVSAATTALLLTAVPTIYFGIMYACFTPKIQKVVVAHWYTYAVRREPVATLHLGDGKRPKKCFGPSSLLWYGWNFLSLPF